MPFLRAIRSCCFTLVLLMGLWGYGRAQVVPDFPLSTTSGHDCLGCIDTVRFLWIQRIYDIGLLLPEWNPVVNWDHVEAVEGIVVPYDSSYTGTHVSQEDFSAYHYTHDFGFNVLPDEPYRRLLARRIYTGYEIEHPVGHADTLIDRNLHVEWESGLAIDAKDNPCAEANRRGESCGFFSAGHQRREIIWNWPSMGDWVHCEGVWIWDRGHPPARTELHPLRLCATRRAMRAYVPRTQGGTDSVSATQIDIFASGDGGALYNNRPDAVPYAHRTPMSARDYAFEVPLDWLPEMILHPIDSGIPPQLRYRIETRNGDSYLGNFTVNLVGHKLKLSIPWRGLPDDAVFARTVYVWWEYGGVTPMAPAMQTYEIYFQDLHFTQRKDVLSRPEKVMWLEAGGQYVCLNEFIEGDDIMQDRQAKTYNRNWKIDLKLRVHAMPGQVFRVHVGGWENDGISRVYGQLLDPNMPCTRASKKLLHSHLWPATPFTMHGCLDDLIGEVHDFYRADTLPDFLQVEQRSSGGESELEPCPGANTEQNNVFTVRYSIRRLRE